MVHQNLAVNALSPAGAGALPKGEPLVGSVYRIYTRNFSEERTTDQQTTGAFSTKIIPCLKVFARLLQNAGRNTPES